jgi:hypothetical protein
MEHQVRDRFLEVSRNAHRRAGAAAVAGQPVRRLPGGTEAVRTGLDVEGVDEL